MASALLTERELLDLLIEVVHELRNFPSCSGAECPHDHSDCFIDKACDCQVKAEDLAARVNAQLPWTDRVSRT